MNIQAQTTNLTDDIKNLITTAQEKAIRAVDYQRVLLYWNIGKRIFEEVQGGEARAEYGKSIIKNLSNELEPVYGSGYGVRQLELMRQFYRIFPIANTLYSQLNWSQYKLLIRLEDDLKREFYIAESVKNLWSKRDLERQINSSLYERLLLSSHLQEFILELGNGFSLVSRQKRLHIDGDDFFVDLVFYNRLLQCFVIFEIKTHKLTHQDIGQLQMYVNYFDRVEKQDFENPTIGVLLCADKNDAVVKYTLPQNNQTILASKYQLYLPSEEELVKELCKELQEIEIVGGEK
jgi:predicted nuclease of restriction endonuclease-like (RecB) superfamily